MAAAERSSVEHSDHGSFEYLAGSREALIAHGRCKESWFPHGPQYLRGGKRKRRFRFVEGDQRICVRECKVGWLVMIDHPKTRAAPAPRRAPHLRLVVDNGPYRARC